MSELVLLYRFKIIFVFAYRDLASGTRFPQFREPHLVSESRAALGFGIVSGTWFRDYERHLFPAIIASRTWYRNHERHLVLES